jgi:hypothetical protein
MNDDPADIASFLKKYLRDCPGMMMMMMVVFLYFLDRPLYTKEFEHLFVDFGSIESNELPMSEQVEKYHQATQKIPELNRYLYSFIK